MGKVYHEMYCTQAWPVLDSFGLLESLSCVVRQVLVSPAGPVEGSSVEALALVFREVIPEMA